jgi:hypothetical protein
VVDRRGLQLRLEHWRLGPGRQFLQRELVGKCQREQLEQRPWEHFERRKIVLIGKCVVYHVRRSLGEFIVRGRLLLRRQLRRFFVRRKLRRIWVRQWLRQQILLDFGELFVVVRQLLRQRIFLRVLQ